ncbi:MAG: hypothetical protein U0736_06620 [Gemmataceae bacterium]
MTDPAATRYDQIPYDSRPTPPTPTAWRHRARGCCTACGRARVETCRVLELGCSTGGNLLSMAECRCRGASSSAWTYRPGRSTPAAASPPRSD